MPALDGVPASPMFWGLVLAALLLARAAPRLL